MAAEVTDVPGLASAQEAKEAGNVYFRQKEWKDARKCYKRAYLLSHPSRAAANKGEAAFAISASGKAPPAMTEAEKEKVAQFTHSLFMNLAAVYLKLEDGEKAVKYAKQAADSAPAPSAKLCLRLGKAYLLLGDLYNAEQVLTEGAKTYTSGSGAAAIRTALATARSRSKAATAALGARLASAFA